MSTVADTFDVVIGVDTHAATHSYVVCSSTGGVLEEFTTSTSPDGLAEAVSKIGEHATGQVLVAMEGTRSYGLGLARVLSQAGIGIAEAEHPERRHRRGKGKSDPIDARRAARSALETDITKLAVPRADGAREGLRILLSARRDLTDERTAKVNALRAVLRSGNDHEHAWATARLTSTLLDTLIRRRGSRTDTVEQQIRRDEIRRLARRIKTLDTELTTNKTTLTELVTQLAPNLLDKHGIGPVSAAQAIVSYSHHGRCRHDAAYAKLAGVSPLEATSGQVATRHRLNRGGDRTLNRAIHAIAVTRMRSCPRTRAYINKRRAEGKTHREIRRCLKRYIARELYRHLKRCDALTLDNS